MQKISLKLMLLTCNSVSWRSINSKRFSPLREESVEGGEGGKYDVRELHLEARRKKSKDLIYLLILL